MRWERWISHKCVCKLAGTVTLPSSKYLTSSRRYRHFFPVPLSILADVCFRLSSVVRKRGLSRCTTSWRWRTISATIYSEWTLVKCESIFSIFLCTYTHSYIVGAMLQHSSTHTRLWTSLMSSSKAITRLAHRYISRLLIRETPMMKTKETANRLWSLRSSRRKRRRRGGW